MSLANRTVNGIVWTGSSTFVNAVINFVILVVLARILSPADFGLMGMVMAVINFVVLFSDFGLCAAIVRQKETNEEELSTIFFLSVGMGIFLFLICFFSSGLIARFFQKTELSYLLKIISVSLIVTASSQTFAALLLKAMNFKALFKVNIMSSIAYGVVSISLALKGFGVRSLVIGLFVRQVVHLISVYMFNPFTPRFLFSIRSVENSFRFGIYVFGERIVNYFIGNLDYIIIGRLLGAEALGYYTLAYNLMLVPIAKIAGAVRRVVFPAFSKVQDDNERMKRGYLKVVRYISLITFPAMAGLFMVSKEFVNVVYGPKWEPVILVLQILCFIGAVQSITTVVEPVLYAKGRSDIGFKWNCFKVCCTATAFILGVRWGIVGVATAFVIVSALLGPVIQGIVHRLIELKWAEFLKQFVKPALGSALVIAAIFMLKELFLNQGNFAESFILTSSIVVGLISYVSFLFFNDRRTIMDILSLLKGGLSKNSL